MGKTVYAAQLWADASDAASVLEEYNSWVSGFYLRNFRISGIEPFGGSADDLPAHHLITCSSASGQNAEVYDLEWEYPSSDDPNIVWRNMVRVATIEGSCLFEHRVLIEPREFIIRPTVTPVGAPNVIRRLCKRNVVRFGNARLKASPYFFSHHDFDQFLALLHAEARQLPIVLLTPFADGEETPIDADKLANALAGVAVVTEAVDQDALWELRAEIGKDLACFDGGARIYWPGFGDNDARWAHPLFLGYKVRERPDLIRARIERQIFGIAAESFVPNAAAETVVREAALEARRASLGDEPDRADWRSLAESYADDLAKQEQEIRELRAKLSSPPIVYSEQEAVEDDGEGNDEVPAEGPPASVAEAVQRAAAKCASLVIAETAIRTAADSPFKRPREVLDALEQLNKVGSEWRARRARGEAGGDLRQMLMAQGLGKRVSMHISTTTRGKYESDYTFKVDGEPTLVEPHITLGSGDAAKCASIHFTPPTDTRDIVVVHVGRHLPNTKT